MGGWRKWFPFPKPHPKPEDEASNELHPVLLIPGIGGSILDAVSNDGKFKERIWVRLYNADQEFRKRAWSKYNPLTGKTESLDPDTHIEIPEDNFGLFSCDILDPDVSVPLDAVCYYHHMIREMRTWGFKDGETLFGFGYDFRQSNRLPETMSRLKLKLESIVARTGRRVDVVTHSMGGVMLKSFLAMHRGDFERLVRKWVAIAAPFRGAPGFILDTLLTGVEFLKGWQKSLFITKWTMHQLMVECPSVYELMADYSFEWEEKPELRIVKRSEGGRVVKKRRDSVGVVTRRGGSEGRVKRRGEGERVDEIVRSESDDFSSSCSSAGGGGSSDSDASSTDGRHSDGCYSDGVVRDSAVAAAAAAVAAAAVATAAVAAAAVSDDSVVEQRLHHYKDILGAMEEALQDNTITVDGRTLPLPFNRCIVEWAEETRRIWRTACLPASVQFYSIYGTGLDTPFHSQYGSHKEPLNDLPDILHSDATFACVHGDGTVPVESALSDGLPALFRVGVPNAEHRELLRLPRVFSLLRFFLEVGGRDEMYDPHTDYVVVPRGISGGREMGVGAGEGEMGDKCQRMQLGCLEESEGEQHGHEKEPLGGKEASGQVIAADVTVKVDVSIYWGEGAAMNKRQQQQQQQSLPQHQQQGKGSLGVRKPSLDCLSVSECFKACLSAAAGEQHNEADTAAHNAC